MVKEASEVGSSSLRFRQAYSELQESSSSDEVWGCFDGRGG